MQTKSKIDLLDEISQNILSIQRYPIKVGISGIDGSGKTSFTKELVDYLVTKTDQQVIIASIDGFHNPREVRYRQGRTSARGYYDDSFNFNAVAQKLLKPLSEHGSRMYTTQIFDVQSDTPVNQTPQLAAPDAILILEGIFLFRPEILPFLDYKIWIDVPFSTALDRMLLRDAKAFKSKIELQQLFDGRYKPGQEIYLNEVYPKMVADMVINNTDFDHPQMTENSETIKALSIRGNIVDIEKDKFQIRVAGYCLIVHENKILLVHVKSTGKYFFPGGEVEAGEGLEAGMKREALEEAGIKIQIEKFLAFKEIFFYYDPKDEALQKYAMFYKCRALTFEPSDKNNLLDDESEKPTWVEIGSLKENDFQSGIYEIFKLL